MFSNSALRKLMIPLIIEQFLAVSVGMADIMMVSIAGETAVSGISLVDTIVLLIIGIFVALATGGAVVSSQYIGFGDPQKAKTSANQLILTTFTISTAIAIFSLLFNKPLLSLIYGKVEPKVMENAITYFAISALSFPFLGVYNGGAAIFRAQGNSKITMIISFIMNIINVCGNAIFLFYFHMEVEGVAIASLISRIVACLIIIQLLRNQDLKISIAHNLKLGFDFSMIKRILRIGIPTGLENGIFQFGKIIVARLITTFGTTAIAANAVGNTLAFVEVIPGMAMGVGLITVVGQCIGANKIKEARMYTFKILKTVYIIEFLLNIVISISLGHILKFYNLTPTTEKYAFQIILLHGVFAFLTWPLAFCLPNALRAANDAKFTMKISILSMFLFRVLFSYILGRYFGLGVLGVWISMMIDWIFRGSFFTYRFFKNKLVPKTNLIQ